jgi:hypothetical protein
MKLEKMKPKFQLLTLAGMAGCLVFLIAACGMVTTPRVTPSATAQPSDSPTMTATTSPTPTAVQPVAVLLASPAADQALVERLQTALNDTVSRAGLRWQARQELSAGELGPEVKLVVAVPPDPGLQGLTSAAPDTQFVALGIGGLEPAPNLTTLGADGDRPDQQGFIAGVIAAMISNDWRVGVISVADTIDGKAARSGFLNGVGYFCGLCRPVHPPFYEYPLYIELPSTASSAEWQEAANYMVDHYAQTVYVYPGAGDESMLSSLADGGVKIISSGEAPQAASSSWVVSLTTDALPLLESQVAGLLDGSQAGGQTLSVPIQFSQVNQAVFTPGKQRLAQQVLADLQNGYIDSGVDLTTGENRP